jgi:hypothetical protein
VTGHGAARPVNSTARLVAVKKCPVKEQRLYSFVGDINSPLAGLGCSLAPLGLSVHTLGVLGEPLTQLCLQQCESIASVILVRCIMRLHRVALGV